MQKITPFLWFNGQAEEAMNFYISVFKDGMAGEVTRYGEAGPGPDGSVMSVRFRLFGQEFFGLNGGPMYTFTPAVSFFVNCKDQQEVDDLWGKLTADGGEASQCGWLKDKYGLSWQIVPEGFTEMVFDKDPEKSQRTMRAMMQMTKLDLAVLKKAYDGE